MPKLEFSHISKSYYAGMNQEVRALIDCTGTVSTDEFVVVVGANGSGKSTFLEILSGSLRPDTGKIHLSEDTLQQDWLALKPFKRNKRVKFVRQDPKLGTVSSFTLAENLLLSKLSRSKPRFFDFKKRY
jgi:putative ABC transport system ATP-binding protein